MKTRFVVPTFLLPLFTLACMAAGSALAADWKNLDEAIQKRGTLRIGFRMVQRRALHALARWRQRYPGGTLLLITHAGVMRALLARYFGLPLEAVWHIPGQCACRRFLPGW